MPTLIAGTADRVSDHTSEQVNQRIHEAMHERVAALAERPEALRRRLHELDQEWDIERWVETLSATLTLGGLTLGATGDRRWLLLSIVVQTFFLQHAIQGWCPPVPVLRRLGVRTQREIEAERHAVKAFLGDYGGVAMQDAERSEASAGVRALQAGMHRAIEAAMR